MLTRVELIFVVLMVSALILIAYEMLKGLFQSIYTIFDQKKAHRGNLWAKLRTLTVIQKLQLASGCDSVLN